MTETMTPPKSKPAKDPNRIPVQHIFFNTGDAMDFPGSQESNIPCLSEPATNGKSYVATYVKDEHSFEVLCCIGGKVQTTRMIPRERVKQWERAA